MLPEIFKEPGWKELRLDINPAVQPDIVASITDMPKVATESVDGIWSSHNLEHLYPHEVQSALREFYRVLKSGGFALIAVPDIQSVAERVASDKLEEVLYVSPAGPISPIDILYGLRTALANGNLFMAHNTGFTATTLGNALMAAGFIKVSVKRDEHYNLWATAEKNVNI